MNIGHWIRWWGTKIAPEHPAIVFGDRLVSYGEMNEDVNRIANALAAHGVGPGDRVAVLLTNYPEFLEIFFAASKVGARFLPLNIRLVGRELEYIINDAGPKLLVSEARFAPLLSGLQDKLVVTTYVTLDKGGLGKDWTDFIGPASSAEPGHEGSWDDDMAICYTSGTTGLPKGAVLTNGNIFWSSSQLILAYGFNQQDRQLMMLPLCFTGGLIPASMPFFHAGGTLILEKDFEPGLALRLIQRHHVTSMMAVPTMYHFMAQHPDFAATDISSLRSASSGGAPVPIPLIEIYQARGVPFTNGYGLTEGGGYNMYLPTKEVVARTGAYLPMMYNQMMVAGLHDQPAPVGETGELMVRGPVVMAGYWGKEDATEEALRGGWLHTGDVARQDEDGYFYIVDRVKDMVVSGGLNVYPAEVESVLYGHPKIREVAIVGLPHDVWGEAVSAVVALRQGEQATAEEIMAFCRDKLADYKRPKAVLFVEALPRNVSGKVLKRHLRDTYAAVFKAGGAP